MQAFVEILALFGVSVDAESFRTNATISSGLVDAVLVGETFVSSVRTFVYVHAVRTRLRYLKSWPALYQRLADERPDSIDASLVLFAFGCSGLTFVDIDASPSICGTIP